MLNSHFSTICCTKLDPAHNMGLFPIPSGTLDCYARHLTVTLCLKSEENDYPVAFPDDLLLWREAPSSSISGISSAAQVAKSAFCF